MFHSSLTIVAINTARIEQFCYGVLLSLLILYIHATLCCTERQNGGSIARRCSEVNDLVSFDLKSSGGEDTRMGLGLGFEFPEDPILYFQLNCVLC